MGLEAAVLIPALIGGAATIGSTLIQARSQENMSRQQGQQNYPSQPQVAYAGAQGDSVGGGLLTGNQPGANPYGTASSDSGAGLVQGDQYSGAQNRYNSAQTLSTAPSLSGTGSGFNGAALLGQPQQQPGQTGVQ